MRPPESVVGYFVRMQQLNPTVAVETNGRGFIGFIVDLPGAYVRGKTEAEAVSKAGLEVSRYLAWIGLGRGPSGGGGGGGGGMSRSFVIQRQTTTASVDQGDTMMLLDADRLKMRPDEFHALSDLVLYSGETFESVYRGAKLKSWTDESRLLPAFYGQRPCTIEQVYSHVRKTQAYYLSRLGVPLQDGDFMMMRRLAVNSLRNEFEHGAKGGNGGGRALVTLEGETWTLRKVLRRFVWHDRIHAKAIFRIVRRQEQLGLVGAAVGEPVVVVDPFHFSSLA